jgi:hypothetical protein
VTRARKGVEAEKLLLQRPQVVVRGCAFQLGLQWR